MRFIDRSTIVEARSTVPPMPMLAIVLLGKIILGRQLHFYLPVSSGTGSRHRYWYVLWPLKGEWEREQKKKLRKTQLHDRSMARTQNIVKITSFCLLGPDHALPLMVHCLCLQICFQRACGCCSVTRWRSLVCTGREKKNPIAQCITPGSISRGLVFHLFPLTRRTRALYFTDRRRRRRRKKASQPLQSPRGRAGNNVKVPFCHIVIVKLFVYALARRCLPWKLAQSTGAMVNNYILLQNICSQQWMSCPALGVLAVLAHWICSAKGSVLSKQRNNEIGYVRCDTVSACVQFHFQMILCWKSANVAPQPDATAREPLKISHPEPKAN